MTLGTLFYTPVTTARFAIFAGLYSKIKEVSKVSVIHTFFVWILSHSFVIFFLNVVSQGP